MPQRSLEAKHVVGARPLLWRKHSGRAFRSEEWAPDVACDRDRALSERLEHRREVDGRDVVEACPSCPDLLAPQVEKAAAQRLEQPGTPVGTSAAAHANDDLRRAGVERDPDELAGAARRCMECVELTWIETSES